MTVIDAYGNPQNATTATDVAAVLAAGGSIVRDNGTFAQITVHGSSWSPASIDVDGVSLVTWLNPNGNSGNPVIPGGNSGTPVLPGAGVFGSGGKPYRLIIPTSPGRVDTGATYAGCSQSNPNACQPIQFADIQTANDYAVAHNEIPHLVGSPEEAWAIVEGRQTVSSVSPTWIAAGVLALVFFLKKKRGS